MPDPLNVPLTPPRVPFTDTRTGNISREWYMFFFSLFRLVGGSNQSLNDLQKAPSQGDLVAQTTELSKQTEGLEVAPCQSQLLAQIADLQTQLDALKLQVQPELGSMASVQQDNARFIGYSLEPSPDVVYSPGVTAWNSDDGTLDVGLYGGSVLQTGQELHYYAKNTSGSTITNGTPVMFTGTAGASAKLTFGLAVADGSVLADYMMGVATQDIANNAFGYITSFGVVRGFDTSAWPDGTLLYFNPAVPGTWTDVAPAAPAIGVPVAVVLNSASGGAGSILVRMTVDESLNRLQDVYINGTGTPANNDILVYDSVDGRWENKNNILARDALGLGTGTPTNGQLLIGNGTDFTTAALTAGTGITITNGAGSITIAASGGGSGATGSFTAASGETITVVDGLVTSIV